MPTDPHVCPSWETLPTCPGPGHRAENTRGERTHHPQTQQGLWALRAKDLAVAQGGAPVGKSNRTGAGLPESVPQAPASLDTPSCPAHPGVTAPSKHLCFSFPPTLRHHSSQDTTHIGLVCILPRDPSSLATPCRPLRGRACLFTGLLAHRRKIKERGLLKSKENDAFIS